MRKRALYFLLLIFLMLDTAYSFVQHYHMSIDGDLAEIVLPPPTSFCYKVLQDPFGLSVFLKHETYNNPNRFFAHGSTSFYFKNIPLFLQNFTDPIDSVYLASALAKILIQLLILYLLAAYISGSIGLLQPRFIIAAALISPLFQTAGYNRYMGIIDPSITYTFFYALPLGLLLLFFLPFARAANSTGNPNISLTVRLLLAILVIILPFSGPLLPGIILIVCPLLIIHQWRSTHARPQAHLILITLLSLYSLYLGTNNSPNAGTAIPLIERYARIPMGLYYQFTQKPGFPLLFLAIGINLFLIHKYYRSEESRKLLHFFQWIAVFAMIYVLLLPLGGFREYRANILRYDTIMPITLGIMFVFGKSSIHLIQNIQRRYKPFYVSWIILFLLLFINADRLDLHANDCEKMALSTIANSPEKIVILKNNCTVMSWDMSSNPINSVNNAGLMLYWHITKENKLYCWQLAGDNQ